MSAGTPGQAAPWTTTPREEQLDALARLWTMAQADHGGANVAAKFLLSLYNGERFPFDLTELRRLDGRTFRDCLQVLQLDWQPTMEVHAHLNRRFGRCDMGARFELMACAWRLKGRVNKAQEQMLRQGVHAPGRTS